MPEITNLLKSLPHADSVAYLHSPDRVKLFCGNKKAAKFAGVTKPQKI